MTAAPARMGLLSSRSYVSSPFWRFLPAIVMPALPRGTSRARLEAYAVATAALLKADHEAALRRQTQVATDVNAMSRLVRSGATGRIVRVPDDVAFDALLPARCGQYRAGFNDPLFFLRACPVVASLR